MAREAIAKYSKRRAARKPEPEENRTGVSSRRCRYDVYDGQHLLGTFVLNEATNIGLAWNRERHFLGRFVGYKRTASAISAADRTRKSAAKAQRRLSEPVGFASGPPG
jgi:hypothetical protein